MESQRRRHKINERRSLLQSNAWKITIASDLPTLQLAANAQPIVRGLQRQMNVLAGLQFDNRQPSGACHGEEVENAVFAPGIGKHLRIDKSLIEHGIDACDVSRTMDSSQRSGWARWSEWRVSLAKGWR